MMMIVLGGIVDELKEYREDVKKDLEEEKRLDALSVNSEVKE